MELVRLWLAFQGRRLVLSGIDVPAGFYIIRYLLVFRVVKASRHPADSSEQSAHTMSGCVRVLRPSRRLEPRAGRKSIVGHWEVKFKRCTALKASWEPSSKGWT
jgi:hypothetical protein